MMVFFSILLLSITSFVSINEQQNVPKAGALFSNERCDRPLAGGTPFVMEKEIWKDVRGFVGAYQISSHGRVKSLLRRIYYRTSRNGNPFWSNKKIKERILKASINDHKGGTGGYYFLNLCDKKFKKHGTEVHKIVAKHFCYRGIGQDYINHKDGNSLNNYYKNLEWGTHRENDCHGILGNPKRKKTSKYLGVHWCSKPGKWKSVIVFRGRNIFIGQYDDEKEAYDAYKKKVKKLGIKNRYIV